MGPVIEGYSYAKYGTSIIKYIDNLEKSIKDVETKRQIGELVLNTVRPYMPYDTGNLDKNSYVDANGTIIFDTPYAHRLYEGVEFNFKKEKHPMACAKWLEVGVAFNSSYILYNTEEIIKKKAKQLSEGGGEKVRM